MDYDDKNDYDLDDEERFGERIVLVDDVGMEYVINPITSARVYIEEDENTFTGLEGTGFTHEQWGPNGQVQ